MPEGTCTLSLPYEKSRIGFAKSHTMQWLRKSFHQICYEMAVISPLATSCDEEPQSTHFDALHLPTIHPTTQQQARLCRRKIYYLSDRRLGAQLHRPATFANVADRIPLWPVQIGRRYLCIELVWSEIIPLLRTKTTTLVKRESDPVAFFFFFVMVRGPESKT